MNNINFDYKLWADTLKAAADSRDPAKNSKYQYITGNGHLTTNSDKNRISLNAMVEISKQAFTALHNDFNKGEINQINYDNLNYRMLNSLSILIERHENKRKTIDINQSKLTKLLRSISRVLSALPLCSSFYFINDNQLNKHIKKMINEDFTQQINDLPNITNRLNEEFSVETHLKLLQKEINKIFKNLTEKNNSISKLQSEDQFEKDIIRGTNFLRKDLTYSIQDQIPNPPRELSIEENERKISISNIALKELIKNQDDEPWELALKSVINQTNLNNLLTPVSKGFDTKSFQKQWKNPDDKKNYYLNAVFSDQLFPIQLEVIRDEKTKNIIRIEIEVMGHLDVVAMNDEDPKFRKLIKPAAITAELRYTLTLDENNHPKVDNLTSKLTA